jgi:hypothetical protein
MRSLLLIESFDLRPRNQYILVSVIIIILTLAFQPIAIPAVFKYLVHMSEKTFGFPIKNSVGNSVEGNYGHLFCKS